MGNCMSGSAEAPQSTTSRTTQPHNTGTKPAQSKKPAMDEKRKAKAKVNKSVGHRLTDDPIEKDVDPREAARRAAELRMQQQSEKENTGALGRKLAKERATGHQKGLKEESEKRLQEKNDKALLYD